MTEADRSFIRHGLIELGRCFISLTNLYKAKLVDKATYEDGKNIYVTVSNMYDRLVNDQVPMNEILSTVSSAKGLINENVDRLIEIVKSKQTEWERYNSKHAR